MTTTTKTYLPQGPQNLRRDQLKLAANNPKKAIDPEKLQDLMASIREDPGMMLDRAIGVADGPSHKLGGFIWGGHQRITALERLYAEGWKTDLWPAGTYPCTVQDIDQKTADERLARDNQQWADWDPGKAVALLKNLERQGTNLRHIGFDDATTRRLTEQAEEASRLLASPPAPVPLEETGGRTPPVSQDSDGEELGAPPPPPDPAGTNFLDGAEASGNPDNRFGDDSKPPEMGDDLHEFVLRITVDQRDKIMKAVHDQRRRNPNQSTAEAMTTICQHYTDSPPDD